MTAALTISSLTFSYPDQPGVLNAIDIEVSEGERVGVAGPNGAGKTTLFMLICGLLKPTAGAIHAFGRPVTGAFRPDIGMVFQNPDDQIFCPSVREDVAFGPRNAGLTREEVSRRVTEALSLAGITALADRVPHHLSTGQKRMVAIAGVLALSPSLVIYDEPTSCLDIRYRRRVIDFLRSSPQTALVASHDLEFILEACTRVVVLDDGQIAADGPPREVLGSTRLMTDCGLERPHSLIPHAEMHHRS